MLSAQPTITQSATVRVSRRRKDMTASLRGFGGARPAVQLAARAAMVQAHEAAMLLSVAATAPVRLFRADPESANGTSPQATAHAAPMRPVLLVHGFGGAKSSWSLVAQALSARGVTVDAISYAPVGNSVEQLADKLVAEVDRTLSRTSADKVHLVGHSLGGVIIAEAILDSRLTGRVDTVVTLGSPFGGSPWAGALPFVEIVRALRRGSPLLRRLASTPLPDGVRWLSVTAALDVVVPGSRSVPFHPQVETITIGGVGHLGMLLSRRVIGCIAAALCAHESATATEPAMPLLRSAS
jgi:pimeloyl-ACP methyl ester carboxylesterase